MWGKKKTDQNIESIESFDPLDVVPLIERARLDYHRGHALFMIAYSRTKQDVDHATVLLERYSENIAEKASVPQIRASNLNTGIEVKP